jgi:general secretion pathway protein I
MFLDCEPIRGAAGFTLIETIVALVLLSSALVVFYDFLSIQLNGAGRVAAAAQAYDRHMNALELATALNPMVMPQGSFDLGAYRIRWTSLRLGEVRQSTQFPAGPGIFAVALYRMTFIFAGGGDVPPISVTRLGYRREDVPSPLIGTAR